MSKTNKYGSLLKFQEVEHTIKSSFCSKNGKAKDYESETFKKHKSRVLRGMSLLCEFLKMNPTQVVEWCQESLKTSEGNRNAQVSMQDFSSWLIKEKKLTPQSAKVTRGNAMSIFKYHGMRINTTNGKNTSEKAKKQIELGIKSWTKKRTILKLMFSIADLEMKAFLVVGLSTGFRISDLIRLKMQMFINWIKSSSDDDLFYVGDDFKENNMIRCVFSRNQKFHIKNYIDSLSHNEFENRNFLFGDQKNNDRRLREKFFTLLHSPKISTNIKKLIGRELEKQENIIHVHSMRSITKSIFCKYTSKHNANLMIGNYSNDPYAEISDDEIMEVYNKSYSQICLDNQGVDSNKTENDIMRKVAAIFKEFFENTGKCETYAHMFHEMSDQEKENLDEEKGLRIQFAEMIQTMKQQVASELRPTIKEEIKDEIKQELMQDILKEIKSKINIQF